MKIVKLEVVMGTQGKVAEAFAPHLASRPSGYLSPQPRPGLTFPVNLGLCRVSLCALEPPPPCVSLGRGTLVRCK